MPDSKLNIQPYLDIWVNEARRLYIENSSDCIMRLKLGIDSFISRYASEAPVELLQDLIVKIEEVLSDNEIFNELLNVPHPSIRLERGFSPIPGYTLIEPIGHGGYGEVWSATAPGDIRVALKFLPKMMPVKAINTRLELLALHIIKNINHVNLAPLAAIWENVNPAYVIYQMPLSDYSLADLIEQNIQKGVKSISRQKLLPYFKGAAQALDYLNFPPANQNRNGIVHCDIKPGNIFVTGDDVRIGDFGSVRTLDASGVGVAGPASAPFMPPEWFNNSVTSWTDQYSLAVTWYYLRTGELPFKTSCLTDKRLFVQTSISSDLDFMPDDAPEKQFRQEHLEHLPDLSLLPKWEQKVLLKALQKDPKQRFATSSLFVDSLQRKSVTRSWLGIVVLIILTLGMYIYYISALQKTIFVNTAKEAGVTMAGHLILLDQYVVWTEKEKKEWDTFYLQCKEKPQYRNKLLENYIGHIENIEAYWKKIVAKGVTPPSEKNLDVLKNNNISVADINAFYNTLFNESGVLFLDYLESLKKNARMLSTADEELSQTINHMAGVGCSFYQLRMEWLYCAWMELICSFPESAKTAAIEQFKAGNPVMGKNVPDNLSAEEYSNRAIQINNMLQKIFEKINEEVKQDELQTLLLEAQVESEETEKFLEELKKEKQE